MYKMYEVERIQKTLEKSVEQPVPYIAFEESTWNMPLVLFLRMEKLFKVHTIASKSNTAWKSLPGQIYSHCDIACLNKGLEVEILLRPTFVSSSGLVTKQEMNEKSQRGVSDSNCWLC